MLFEKSLLKVFDFYADVISTIINMIYKLTCYIKYDIVYIDASKKSKYEHKDILELNSGVCKSYAEIMAAAFKKRKFIKDYTSEYYYNRSLWKNITDTYKFYYISSSKDGVTLTFVCSLECRFFFKKLTVTINAIDSKSNFIKINHTVSNHIYEALNNIKDAYRIDTLKSNYIREIIS